MGIIKVVGALTNVCGNVAFDNIVKPLVKETGNKIVDKVIVPWGVCVAGWMVGSAVEEYIVGEMKEVKKGIDSVKNIVNEYKHPYFMDAEDDEFECDDFEEDFGENNVPEKTEAAEEEATNGEN